MLKQFRFLANSLLITSLLFTVSGCVHATTPTPYPASTFTAVPSQTATAAPSATPTTVPSATPTKIPSATSTAKPTTTATAVPSNTATQPAPTIKPTSVTTSTTSSSASTSAPVAAAGKTVCLTCHPYDQVITASANYVMPSGEKTSPHRYINAKNADNPHAATGVDNIPECSNCHTAHPIPPTEKVDLSKVGVDWCYSTCHHQNDFTPCNKCHTN